MPSLADEIEEYIKLLLEQNKHQSIEIKRNHLARLFECVPSQINYVITTRFTVEQGYIVESRRGGQGYLKVKKITLQDKKIQELLDDILKNLNEASFSTAEEILNRLHKEGILRQKEVFLLKEILSPEVFSPLKLDRKTEEKLRGNILRKIILTLTDIEF
jgi:transcriptional regulator CtsR